MKKNSKKSYMILTLISIVICGCPGCFLVLPGFINMIGELGRTQAIADLPINFGEGIIQGGWMVCPGSLLVLIPIVLAIIAVVKKGKKEELVDLQPTGVSKADPIPPPS